MDLYGVVARRTSPSSLPRRTATGEEGLRTIAFPSISTGAYGYPIDKAAEVALRTIKETIEATPGAFDEVRFVLFSETDFVTYRGVAERVVG